MIFAHTHLHVLSGKKTQTRRLVHPGDFIAPSGNTVLRWNPNKANPIVRYLIGSTYAVQPSRGSRSVARLRITSIRREDVREISDADVKAEAFADRWAFLQTWAQMYDQDGCWEYMPSLDQYRMAYGRKQQILSWQKLLGIIDSRPAKFYDAWVLTFELVKGREINRG